MTHTVFLARVHNVGTSQVAGALDMFDVADGVDFEDAAEDACLEFFATEDGKKLVIEMRGSVAWGDFIEKVPDKILSKYGIRRDVPPPGRVMVVHNNYPILPGRQDIILNGGVEDLH
jgi:hypothetical protein